MNSMECVLLLQGAAVTEALAEVCDGFCGGDGGSEGSEDGAHCCASLDSLWMLPRVRVLSSRMLVTSTSTSATIHSDSKFCHNLEINRLHSICGDIFMHQEERYTFKPQGAADPAHL